MVQYTYDPPVVLKAFDMQTEEKSTRQKRSKLYFTKRSRYDF